MDDIFETIGDAVSGATHGNGKWWLLGGVGVIGVAVLLFSGKSSGGSGYNALSTTSGEVTPDQLNASLTSSYAGVAQSAQNSIDALAKAVEAGNKAQDEMVANALKQVSNDLSNQVRDSGLQGKQYTQDIVNSVTGKIDTISRSSQDVNVALTRQLTELTSVVQGLKSSSSGSGSGSVVRTSSAPSSNNLSSPVNAGIAGFPNALRYPDGYVDYDGGVRNNATWTMGGTMLGKTI